MKVPMTVTFHDVPRLDWIEEDLRARAEKLETYCPDIVTCRILLDMPHRHHEGGNRFSVHLDLVVPDDEIAVTRTGNVHATSRQAGEQEWVKQFDVEATQKDLRLVVRRTFDVARRRLQDYTRKRRHEVKRHEEPPRTSTEM
jgi:hypothetical protein